MLSSWVIYDTAKSLLANLGISLRHDVELFAVSIMFARLRPRQKHFKVDIG